jgi:hypothetical protein
LHRAELGGAHGGALHLEKVSVAKLDDIISHHQSMGGNQGLNRDVGAEEGIASEVAGNLSKRGISIDVSVHADGIRGEEAGRGRKIHVHELLFDTMMIGALEVGLLSTGDFLEVVVDPDTEAV